MMFNRTPTGIDGDGVLKEAFFFPKAVAFSVLALSVQLVNNIKIIRTDRRK